MKSRERKQGLTLELALSLVQGTWDLKMRPTFDIGNQMSAMSVPGVFSTFFLCSKFFNSDCYENSTPKSLPLPPSNVSRKRLTQCECDLLEECLHLECPC